MQAHATRPARPSTTEELGCWPWFGGGPGGGNCVWRAPAIGSGGCAGHQCSPTAGAGESEAARPVEAGHGGCWLRRWWLELLYQWPLSPPALQPTLLTTPSGGAAQGTLEWRLSGTLQGPESWRQPEGPPRTLPVQTTRPPGQHEPQRWHLSTPARIKMQSAAMPAQVKWRGPIQYYSPHSDAPQLAISTRCSGAPSASTKQESRQGRHLESLLSTDTGESTVCPLPWKPTSTLDCLLGRKSKRGVKPLCPSVNVSKAVICVALHTAPFCGLYIHASVRQSQERCRHRSRLSRRTLGLFFMTRLLTST